MRIIYTQPNSFTINLLGECQFSIDDKRQLSVTSRIGFWGCWLVGGGVGWLGLERQLAAGNNRIRPGGLGWGMCLCFACR